MLETIASLWGWLVTVYWLLGVLVILGVVSLLIFIVVGVITNLQWEKKHYVAYHDVFIPQNQIKRVAIIGAGSSGIAAAKECLQAGFEVVVYEQTRDIGGNWVYKEEESHSSVYRSTFINTSRQLMCFSDYPMPEDLPTYPHHKQIIKYFVDYSNHFGVTPNIRFNTQVTNIALQGANNNNINNNNANNINAKWVVSSRHCPHGTPLYMLTESNPEKYIVNNSNHINQMMEEDKAGQITDEVFDAVLLCNGHHSVPRYPENGFPGQEKFKGTIFHSHSYKHPTNPYNLIDKRVLVVGIGNSGVDIATELSRVSAQVYLSTRSGAYIYPKYIGGKALDHVYSPTRMLRYIVPPTCQDYVYNWFANSVIKSNMGSMESWGLKPECGPLNMHPTISQELLPRVGTGTIRLRPNIKEIREDSVIFEDNQQSKVDAIILCTGYNIQYHFLSPDLFNIQHNKVELFNNFLSPSLPPTIAFIGLIQPLGAIMPIAEMQARVMCQIWLGKSGLPSVETMKEVIKENQNYIAKRYLSRDRHTIQVDFDTYMFTLAAMIGCVPKIFNHLSLFRPLLFGPIWPSHFRLDGPDAWDGASKAILRANAQIYERPENEASTHWLEDDENENKKNL